MKSMDMKNQVYKNQESYLLWGHILPYTKDGLVQPKHILRASSLGEDNFSLTKWNIFKMYRQGPDLCSSHFL